MYRFFPLLSLLPVRATANVTIGPLPHTKHFLDILSPHTEYYMLDTENSIDFGFSHGLVIRNE
jgi:hypothetical protein